MSRASAGSLRRKSLHFPELFQFHTVAAAVMAAGMGAAPAAEVAPGEEQGTPTELQEIIVTAEKREESINSVPMSIAAFTGDKLQQMGINSVADLVKVASGFRYSEGNNGTPIYSIRGIGFNETSLGALPNVPVYVDEVPIAFPIMTRGIALDLERVEVLKGPQGTLFGQSATGGAINYIAAKPTDAFQSAITAGYGRFNDASLDGFLSGPIAGTVTARLSFSAERADPWQYSETTGQKLGRRSKLAGRLLVNWQPIESLKLAFNFTGTQDKSDPQALQYSGYYYQFPPGVPYLTAVERNAIENTPLRMSDRAADWGPRRPTNNAHMNQFSLRADYAVWDSAALTYIGSDAHFNRFEYSDPDGMPIENSEGETRGRISSWSHELRLAGDAFGARLHWLGGINYVKSTVDQLDTIRLSENSNSKAICAQLFGALFGAGACSGPLSAFLINNANNITDQDFTNKAVFAAVDFAFTDQLKGHLAARRTKATDEFTGCSADVGDDALATAINGFTAVLSGAGLVTGGGSTIAPGGCVTGVLVGPVVTPQPTLIRQSLDESNTSWRTGLDWKLARDSLLYVNVSKGYKGGSFPDLSAFSPDQYSPVVQESLLATELGLKSTFNELRLQLDAAAFYYDYKNKQVRGSINTGFPFGVLPALVNVPKSHEYGFDLQAVWKPIPGWTAAVNATFVKSRIDSFNNDRSYDDFTLVTHNFAGESLPNTPQVLANADIQYEWNLSADYSAFVGANVNYESATHNGFGEYAIVKIDPYALLDLRAGVESIDQRWRVSLWGHNVTDKYYWINQLRIGDTITKVTGMPITYGATLTYRFK
jgi:outer membrane receptor protein involved in Fe transport